MVRNLYKIKQKYIYDYINLQIKTQISWKNIFKLMSYFEESKKLIIYKKLTHPNQMVES